MEKDVSSLNGFWGAVEPVDIQQVEQEILSSVLSGRYQALSPEFAGEPGEIKTELEPVPAFDLGLLPESYRKFVRDVSHRMQCPPEFVAVPLMVVTGSVIGTGCAIQPKEKDNWKVVPNLWGGVVGRPGVMKSPPMNEVLSLLNKLQAKADADFEEKQRDVQIDIDVHQAQKDALQSQLKATLKSAESSTENDIETIKEKMKALLPPAQASRRRYKTNDATMERLGELLAENPRGILLCKDELTGFLKQLDREENAPSRAFHLECWNGYGSYDTDRIGRGNIAVDKLCESVVGGIQPNKLTPYLRQAISGENDGLAQRLQLLVYPDTLDWKYTDERPDSAAREEVIKILSFFSETDFYSVGARQDDDVPYLRFTAEAQDAYVAWMNNLEMNKIRREDEEPVMAEHLSKYRSLMPSLALVIELVEAASKSEAIEGVSLASIEKAIKWCEYLEMHARRVYGLVLHNGRSGAARLSREIRNGNLVDGFTIRDIKRKEWQGFKEEAAILEALEILVDENWVEAERSGNQTGRRTTRYRINPKIQKCAQ